MSPATGALLGSIAGAALGAVAAVLLTNKDNRDKLKTRLTQ